MGGKSNPIKDIIDTTLKAVDDTFKEVDRVASGGGIHLDPYVKQKQEAKDEAKKDARNKARALAKQKESESNLRKQKIANQEYGKGGTSIILGGNKKKDKSSSISSGMGLSKGKTGLQE